MNKWIQRGLAVAVVTAPVVASAAGEPVDLSATATQLAGYVAAAAGLAVTVFAAKKGVNVLLGVFSRVLGR